MKTNLIIVGLAAIILAGCLAPASNVNAVQIGMSKAQVLKIMGTPASITADTNAEYLNYTLAEHPVAQWAIGTLYEIKLVNGKVISYGRAAGVNQPARVTEPVVVPVMR